MAAQTAQIIDFEERRRMRREAMIQAGMMHDSAQQQAYRPTPQPAMVFVPVWFAPVFFFGSPAGQA